MAEVIFQIENGEEVRITANVGANLLETARSANVAIDAPCSGNGSCGKCRVKLISGKLDGVQTSHITDEEYAEGWRLSCSSRIASDDPVVVMVPDIASAYKSRISTADLSDEAEQAVFRKLQENLQEAGLEISHPYKSVCISMDEPTNEDTMPDNERFQRAFCEAVGCSRVILGFHALKKLAEELRKDNFCVTAIYKVHGSICRVLDVTAGKESAVIGAIAIDIGTTTVTGVLTDINTGRILGKASAGNGQIRYGADVINRIVEQQKPGGVEKLQKAIIDETLVPLINIMTKQGKMDPGQIVRVTIAGNSTMNHLFVGANANSLRMEPYIPTFFSCDPFAASNVKLPVNPDAEVILAPNIGSYVGGDITAGVLSSGIWNMETYSLFIDLGTNGELVFGTNEFMMSCACSAGPAFEGGDISCGMRATDGAVQQVKIDPVTMEPSLDIIGKKGQKPVGICGSGIIDIISELYKCGIIDSKGKFKREGKRVAQEDRENIRYVLAFKDESSTGREISINEVDIESFIRAKGAIFSAINTMLLSLDMSPEIIDNIYVAGGIGKKISIENAIGIGMFPDIDRSKYTYIGNSSLAGAYAMTISDKAAAKVHEIASNITYLELSTYPGYMDKFVAACFIPHTDASLFPSVKTY